MKHKYWKERHCDYPCENDGLSYCWSYATFVDKGKITKASIKKFENKICKGSVNCAFYCKRKGRLKNE